MFKKYHSSSLGVFLAVATCAWIIGPSGASAQGFAARDGYQGHTGHYLSAGSGTRTADTGSAHQPAHGGQMTMAGPYCFEVVYRPKETRLYLNANDHRPISAQSVQGQVSMRVRGIDKVFTYPLKYVAPQPGSPVEDYVAVAVDVTRLRDGDMTVTFELANLPNPQQPQAAFTQTFALSKLQVAVAPLDPSDRPLIDAQKVCPVSGGRLGSMGSAVKVLVGNQPIYLCCKGCLARVQANPESYLEKVTSSRSQSGAAATGGIVVATATAADQAAIQTQRTCPVMGTALGQHGAPVKVTVNGQSLFVCCKGCVGKVESNPDYYVAKAAQLRSGH